MPRKISTKFKSHLMRTASLPPMIAIAESESTTIGCRMETVDGLLQEHDDTENDKIRYHVLHDVMSFDSGDLYGEKTELQTKTNKVNEDQESTWEQNVRISKAETKPHLRETKDEYDHCRLNICYDATVTSRSTTEETSSIQDDDSESSLLVLLRYIGCGPPRQSSQVKIDQKIGKNIIVDFNDEDGSELSVEPVRSFCHS